MIKWTLKSKDTTNYALRAKLTYQERLANKRKANKKWNDSHKERKKQLATSWRENNRERYRELARRHYQKHKEQLLKIRHQDAEKNPEKYRKISLNAYYRSKKRHTDNLTIINRSPRCIQCTILIEGNTTMCESCLIKQQRKSYENSR